MGLGSRLLKLPETLATGDILTFARQALAEENSNLEDEITDLENEIANLESRIEELEAA